MDFSNEFKPMNTSKEKRTGEPRDFMEKYDIWCSYFVNNNIAQAISFSGNSLQMAHRLYAGLSEAGLAKIEEDKLTGTKTFHSKEKLDIAIFEKL